MTENMGKADKFAEELLARLSWNKKSVRTTFKLSQKAIDMLAELTEREGKTIKDFFDTFFLALLVTETPLPGQEHDPPLLPKLNDEDEKVEYSKIDRQIRKTYVLSETGLMLLESYAKQYKMPRDAFVEYAVRFSGESLARHKEENRQRYVPIYEILNPISITVEQLWVETKSLLDSDDPVRDGLNDISCRLMELCSSLKDAIN